MQECAKCQSCFEDDVSICPEDGSATKPSAAGPTLLNKRYRLTSVIRGSSLGRVFLAKDEILAGREVVVRLLERVTIESVAWQSLGGLMSSVQNPNVVETTDFGETPEKSIFVVMELISSINLREYMEGAGKIKSNRAAAILRQIASGVEAVHAVGLLHGALNPNNVFIETRFTTLGGFGKEELVKISDFGWKGVRELDVAGSGPDPGNEYGRLGAIEYLAPEQVQPDKPIDRPADVYGLGALAYYLMSGEPPFTGDLMQVVVEKTMGEPEALSKRCVEIPEPVSQLVMAAMNIDAAKRPASIAEWMAEIEEMEEDGVADAAAPAPPIVVVAAPAGTTIFLDDEEQGTVDAAGEFSLLLVQPGVHLVLAKFADGSEADQVLEVPGSGRSGALHVDFSRNLAEPMGSSQEATVVVESPAPAPIADLQPAAKALATPVVDEISDPVEPPPPMEAVSGGASSGGPEAAGSVQPSSAPDLVAPSGAARSDSSNQVSRNIICEKCGGSIRANSKFCRACGARVAPSAPLVQEPSAAPFQVPEVAPVADVGVTPVEPVRVEPAPVELAPVEPAPVVEPEPSAPISSPVVDLPRVLPDTYGSSGGVQLDVPVATPPRPDPAPERPKTIESAAVVIRPDAPPKPERSPMAYLLMGLIVGLILLIVLGAVGFGVYWFVLAKS